MIGACFVKQTFATCSGVVEGALNSLVVLTLVCGAFCLASQKTLQEKYRYIKKKKKKAHRKAFLAI